MRVRINRKRIRLMAVIADASHVREENYSEPEWLD